MREADRPIYPEQQAVNVQPSVGRRDRTRLREVLLEHLAAAVRPEDTRGFFVRRLLGHAVLRAAPPAARSRDRALAIADASSGGTALPA